MLQEQFCIGSTRRRLVDFAVGSVRYISALSGPIEKSLHVLLLFILLTAVMLATAQTNSSPKAAAARDGSTASAKKAGLIDINSATAEELDSLPGSDL